MGILWGIGGCFDTIRKTHGITLVDRVLRVVYECGLSLT